MARSRGLGYFGRRLVLRCGDAIFEDSFATIELTIHYLQLLGKQLRSVLLPEARLRQYPVDMSQCLPQASQQGVQEPLEPCGDIQAALLAGFQDVVVAFAVTG